MSKNRLTPELLSGALGLARISISDLCVQLEHLSRPTASRFLNRKSETLSEAAVQEIYRFFENRNIEILSNGVRFFDTIQPIKGQDGFQQVYNDLYETIKDGGFFYILNGVAQNFTRSLGEDYLQMHVERMQAIADRIDVRAIVKYHDRVFFGRDYAQYRWIDDAYFPPTTKIIYNGRVAFIDMNEGEPTGELYRNSHNVESEILNFKVIWEKVAEEFNE